MTLTFDEAIQWIHSIGRFGVKPGLERITVLLERLGNPHHKLNFVHIGGTNGKGSTAALLASVLETAGYRVGLYTSPYLEAFNNRISINGEDIPAHKLVEHVEKIRPLVADIAATPDLGQPTEFEVVTALALDYYAAQAPDLVILEVGLGGRLDATNVVTPLISVITNVSLDHTSVLGDTVEEVAGEKAGIIKENVPVVTSARDADVQKILLNAASLRGAPFYQLLEVGYDYGIKGKEEDKFTLLRYKERELSGEGQKFDYYGRRGDYENVYIPLKGRYQVQNAALSVAVMELLGEKGFVCSEASLRSGLEQVFWPGRLEVLQKNPTVVLDAAHNPAAMEELTRAIQEFFSFRHLYLVMGVMEDKNISEIMQKVIPLAHTAFLTRPSLPRAADPLSLRQMAANLTSCSIVVEPEIDKSLLQAIATAQGEDLILVTGSFYTISEARQNFVKDFVKKT